MAFENIFNVIVPLFLPLLCIDHLTPSPVKCKAFPVTYLKYMFACTFINNFHSVDDFLNKKAHSIKYFSPGTILINEYSLLVLKRHTFCFFLFVF